MEIELGGQRFALKADLAALMAFEKESGIKFETIGEGSSLWQVGTLVYHFAKRGAAVKNMPFDHTPESFLGLVEVNQMPYLLQVMSAIMGGEPDTGEKKGEPQGA